MQIIRKHLDQEHYALRRKFEKCNPALTITKTVKMFLVRKRIKRKIRQIRILYFMLRRWRKRLCFRKFMVKLGLTDRVFLRRTGMARFIQKWWREKMRVLRIKTKVARRLQSNARMWASQNKSFLGLLGLNTERTNTVLMIKEAEESAKRSRTSMSKIKSTKPSPKIKGQESPNARFKMIKHKSTASKRGEKNELTTASKPREVESSLSVPALHRVTP